MDIQPIKEAFDNTRFDVIASAARGKGVDEATVKFIGSILNSLIVTTTVNNNSVIIKATEVYPEGKVVSLYLWALVMEIQYQCLKQAEFITLAYAYDCSRKRKILVIGKFRALILIME